MAKGRRKRKCKKVYCVMAGKTKVSCFAKKGKAKRSAKARRKAGKSGRVVKRCRG